MDKYAYQSMTKRLTSFIHAVAPSIGLKMLAESFVQERFCFN